MSQYRPEDVSHSASEVKSPRDLHQNSMQESTIKTESHDISHTSHAFTSVQIRSEYTDEYVNKSVSNEYSISKQTGTEYPTKSTSDFSTTKQLETYSKQLHNEPEKSHQNDVDESYTASKMETRHSHTTGPVPFSNQTRFLSGQNLSQTTGPTPTLNQLLQASSPVHRFHTSYPSIGHETYQQPWPIQRPSVVPPVYPQPSQRPPPTGSPRLHHGTAGPSSPTPMPYQSYSQRFASPTRSHSPYSHHQLNSYGLSSTHSPNLYSEQRGWSQTTSTNPSVTQSTNQTNSSSQSPQRALSQSPAPPPCASPQPQASNQTQEISNQNSNDSSNGPAGPTTPTSQGMRPTPSPTGSTGSRSMSPAVVQQTVQMPPRPSSSQSDGGAPSRMSLSPLATQGSKNVIKSTRACITVHISHAASKSTYGPSPHMHNYKPSSSGQNAVSSGSGSSLNSVSSITSYVNSGSNQTIGYSSQGNYTSIRPYLQFAQNYPQGNNTQTSANGQYQTVRPNNAAQYSSYSHKIGLNNIPCGMSPSSNSTQSYVTGLSTSMISSGTSTVTGISSMGPPMGSMGPPAPSPSHLNNQHIATGINSTVHINTSTQSLSVDGSPMPPPSTTPNSHTVVISALNNHNTIDSTAHGEPSSESGILSHVPISTAIITTSSNSTVTSIITTGPDGSSLDEGSQQSTLSNASAASGEDPVFTPKVRKDLMVYHSHPATPQSTVPSPGAASINSVHEDYPDTNSPSWPRTPASPVYNSHVSQDPYRSKKSDSLSKLYEMDDSMERRSWLDKLVGFMEERRTPITSCPTISKNPLDLFRLYLYVKERGGFMEVCKVTKNKTWKDIAGLLGIGASSSAAYTLRKHYTKHLLAYECHFDRGGVDPQPIINQVEAGTKKKGAKGTSSVPSPGSSNSQDSFPAGGSNNPAIDNYGNYSNNYSGTVNAGTSGDYNPSPPRPPSQSSTTSHSSSYQNPTSFQNYSQDQYIRPQGSALNQQSEFNQPYSTRAHYPPYVSDIERGYSNNNIGQGNSGNQDIYNRYSANQPVGTYSSGSASGIRCTYSTASQGHSTNSQQQTVSSQQTTSLTQSTSGNTYSSSQDYYRQDQTTYGPPIGSQIYPNPNTINKTMPPPPSGPQQPRRHPDFIKEQQYSSYNQQRPGYTGWQSGNNQYSGNTARIQYTTQSQSASQPQHQQPLQSTPSVVTSVSSTISGNNSQQWNNQQSNRSNTQSNMNSLLHAQSSWEHRYNQNASLYTTPGSHQTQLGISPVISQQSMAKREMAFPTDSIEAITPLLYKRRKLTRSEVAPVEAWRIMMALRSGLLAESCWALDVLNILLFDDSSVHYFGLTHLPGLLDVLLEHFSRALSDMFDFSLIDEGRCLYEHPIHDAEIDLGAVTKPVDPEDRIKILSSSNYTFLSRRGKPVKIVPRDDDIFVLDSRRTWDFQESESEVEPWQVDSSSINYIVTCFKSEVSSVSFTSQLKTSKAVQKESDKISSNSSEICFNYKETKNTIENIITDPEAITEKIDLNNEFKQQEKKKKSKTLSDVLSRIKKEPLEMNDLTRELSEKKADGPKKDTDSDGKNNHNFIDDTKPELISNDDATPFKENNSNITISKFISDNTRTKEILKTHYESEKNKEIFFDNNEAESIKLCSIQEHHSSKLKIRDPAGTLKRRRISDYEDESYSRDEASLYLVTETQDNLARRCVCLSTILRNLTFIPGNELEFAKNVTFLSLLGKLLLLHHDHPTRAQKTRNYDREEDADFTDCCSSLQSESEWWWDFLYHIRENVLVMSANIAGYVDLSQYPEEISRPVLDGLLHWAICPAAHGQDPFPTVSLNSSLSPQRLALEALCKLCVTESNVDLVVATPPYSRLQKLCSVLSRLLCRSEEQVLREFGVNLLHFLSAADSGVARTIALQTPCVALLVAFIEQAENSALGVANQHGIAALRDNPESMGTSLDMLRRAAGTLLNLSRHPDNRTLLLQHESRLLALVMSQILDQQVAAIVARVLYQCSRGAA
ncbi:trithorax group protein osa isoform X3 [Nasonia vitripennis]|uniref:ARID domain-containing protein n=1 Tax=Nasonia vitripennis TaxID=7425 RepID=A0A7M7QDQ6_NASVI|nr:trithorax group protein osa isoform X3 [Nasonia vitripennis]